MNRLFAKKMPLSTLEDLERITPTVIVVLNKRPNLARTTRQRHRVSATPETHLCLIRQASLIALKPCTDSSVQFSCYASWDSEAKGGILSWSDYPHIRLMFANYSSFPKDYPSEPSSDNPSSLTAQHIDTQYHSEHHIVLIRWSNVAQPR